MSRSSNGSKQAKQKVTLSIDRTIWQRFLIQVIWETNKQKEASHIVQNLIEKYLEGKHTGQPNPGK